MPEAGLVHDLPLALRGTGEALEPLQSVALPRHLTAAPMG